MALTDVDNAFSALDNVGWAIGIIGKAFAPLNLNVVMVVNEREWV